MRSLLLIALCLPLCQAFLFWSSSGRQEAEAEVSQDCMDKAAEGDCHFYTCFDERHPCTKHNWALSYGWRYCTRYDQERERFTPEAQEWVTNSRRCAMQALLNFYEADHINCEDVEYAMKEEYAKCERDNGVCESSIVYDNREALLDIYKFSRTGLVRFLMYVRECGGTELDEFLEWVEEQRDLATPYVDSMKDLLDYIAETDWNIEEWGLEIPEFEIEWPDWGISWYDEGAAGEEVVDDSVEAGIKILE